MQLSFENLLEKFRACVHCGALGKPWANPFCHRCFSFFLKYHLAGSPIIHNSKGFEALALLEWTPNDLILNKLISNLKGKHRKIAWDFFAKQFVRFAQTESRFKAIVMSSKQILVIPAPRKNIKVDHAYLWGEALAKEVGAELLDCLHYHNEEVGNSISQKRKTSQERTQLTITRDEKFTPNKDDCYIVFVDDVITTGSTAAAAFFALDCPKHFAVWTLASRTLLV